MVEEVLLRRARSFSPNLYLTLPSEVKRRRGVKRGDRILCFVRRVLDSKGGVLAEVGREVECRVEQRDDRVYLPPELIRELNLLGTEYFEFSLQRIVKGGEKKG